jgi:alkylation response protein AidB-like acyl-CoA dehydrogenase
MNQEEGAVTSDLDALRDEDFRRTIRDWIRANYPPELRHSPHRLHWPEIRPWYMRLAEQGWLAPGWPKEHGGMGLSAGKQLIYMEEMERHGTARMPDMGITMIGPLLIGYGSEEQRRRFLPRILDGSDIWCQGYSEPSAGSDLANLRTEAVRRDGEYVVNGHKIWTTLATDANWMFMLARTSKAGRKQEGISFLLAELRAAGVTVRPIINLAGHDEFCEVFFDNVVVPAENIVGEVDKGWAIAKALLGFERIFLGSPKQSAYALGCLRTLAAARGLFDDPGFVDRFTRLRLDLSDLTSLYRRFAEQVRRGEELGPDVSMLKVFATETFQRITELMVEVTAESACLLDPNRADNAGIDVLSLSLQARPATIYGGSNEIQRNILAKHVLHLPG